MVERVGSAKGIVFSQFSSFLDFINYSLQKSSVRCVQLDTNMSSATRDGSINKFKNDGDCKILLTSLKVVDDVPHLSETSHVFLMDQLLDPATEQKAQDRVHGIRQVKTTRIVRFLVENTIEEKILKLREVVVKPREAFDYSS